MKKVKKILKPKPESPHNSRIFPAWVIFLRQITLWTLFIALLTVNIVNYANSSMVNPSLTEVLLGPLSPASHTRLADFLWHNKMSALAKHELAIAQYLQNTQFQKNSPVLGESSDSILSRWVLQKENTEEAYEFWLGVIKEKPDYRDAYLTLATLAYQLDRMNEARQFVTEAKKIDLNVQVDTLLTEELKIN